MLYTGTEQLSKWRQVERAMFFPIGVGIKIKEERLE